MALVGLLNLRKPAGVTSRRAIDRVARLVKPAKVGHAGTLDPLATGVLVVGVGQATRLVEYVQQMLKHYRATFLLGRSSTTEDVEGEVTIHAGDAIPALDELQAVATTLMGTIEQRPPDFSALKVQGHRAYALARAGQQVELTPRPVRIDRLEITRFDYPELDLDIQCGSGTYVRSLGRDLAERAGTHAVMSALERTAIGRFHLADAVSADDLTADNLPSHLLPSVRAIEGLFEVLTVSADDARRLANGLEIACPGVTAAQCAAVDSGGRLLAIVARGETGTFRPSKVFPE